MLPRSASMLGPCASVASVGVVLMVLVLVLRRASEDPAALALATVAAASCALVLAACLTNLARNVIGVEELWVVVVLLSALGAKAVVTAAFATGSSPTATAALLADLTVLALALAAAVVGSRAETRIPPLTVGALVGLGGSSLWLLKPFSQVELAPAVQVGLSVLVLVSYVGAALTVRRSWPWSRTSGWIFSAAVLALGAAQSLEPHAHQVAWLGVASALDHLLAALLLGMSIYAVVTSDLFAERRRLAVMWDQLLTAEEAARQAGSDRHALLNLVAGISMASELLVEEEEVEEPVRKRLEHSIHHEAMQVCALLQVRQDIVRATVPPPDGPTPLPAHRGR